MTSQNFQNNNVYASSSTVSVTPIVAEESDSDLGPNQLSTSNSRSRQKKFLKTFKHLPQEELVLQRKLFMLFSGEGGQIFGIFSGEQKPKKVP